MGQKQNWVPELVGCLSPPQTAAVFVHTRVGALEISCAGFSLEKLPGLRLAVSGLMATGACSEGGDRPSCELLGVLSFSDRIVCLSG